MNPRVCFVAPFGLGQKTTVWARTLPLARVLATHGWRPTLLIPPWDTPQDDGRRWKDGEVELINIALRGGAMFSPRGAGLAGLDFDLPQLSLMPNWSGRVDADVIFKANFSGLRTVVPVTLNQIYTSPNVAGRSVYFGGGAGALLGGKAKLDIKALAGVGLTRNMDIEVNAHFLEGDTLVTALVRLSR